jgi:hypothetical protein
MKHNNYWGGECHDIGGGGCHDIAGGGGCRKTLSESMLRWPADVIERLHFLTLGFLQQVCGGRRGLGCKGDGCDGRLIKLLVSDIAGSG